MAFRMATSRSGPKMAILRAVKTVNSRVWAGLAGRGASSDTPCSSLSDGFCNHAQSPRDNPISISPLTTHHCSRSRTLHTSHKKKTARARTWRMHAYTIANRGLGVLCHPFRPPVSA